MEASCNTKQSPPIWWPAPTWCPWGSSCPPAASTPTLLHSVLVSTLPAQAACGDLIHYLPYLPTQYLPLVRVGLSVFPPGRHQGSYQVLCSRKLQARQGSSWLRAATTIKWRFQNIFLFVRILLVIDVLVLTWVNQSELLVLKLRLEFDNFITHSQASRQGDWFCWF